MPIDQLMQRSRDAARRTRKALAGAKSMEDYSDRKAAAGTLREIKAYADTVRRLQKIDAKFDTAQRRLRVVRRDADRSPEVRRREVARLEVEIAGLKAARRELATEVSETLLSPQAESAPPRSQNFGDQFEEHSPTKGRPATPVSPSKPANDTGARIIETWPPSGSEHTAQIRSLVPPHREHAILSGIAEDSVRSDTILSGTKARPRDDWAVGLPDIPLTDAGAVDVEALKTGQVYRMPTSAGGGLGRWTNGLFYNYDGEADWDVRSAANLDAYSGVSGLETPEERRELLSKWLKSGGAFTPAIYLKAPDFGDFNRKQGEGVRARQGDDVVSFRLGEGPDFLTLPDDAAAFLVRNWRDFEPRVKLLSRLFAYDMSPKEMRRLVEAEVYRGIPESERYKPSAMKPDRTMYAFDDPFGGQRRIAEYRMHVFEKMVDGIRHGASDEEVAQLIRDFQEIVLPELMGAGRFLKEFIKDMVPGLNNVRSGFHFWNDIAELEEEWKEGDIAGLAGNSVLLLLDGLGLIPIVGSAFAPVRSALKKGGRAIVGAVPRLDGLVAQAQLWRHRLQWPNLDHKIDASSIFGTVFDKLPPDIQRKVRSKNNFAFGYAGGEHQQGLLGRMDSAAQGQTRVNIDGVEQAGLPHTRARTYDGLARDATDLIVDDIMRWLGPLIGRQWDRLGAGFKHYEFKTGGSNNALQNIFDALANSNPGMLTDVFGNAVERVERTRIYPEQIPMDLAIQHAQKGFTQLVANNVIDAMTSRELLDAMKASYERGTKFIGLFDYAGLYVNLLAAAGHRGRTMSSESTTDMRID